MLLHCLLATNAGNLALGGPVPIGAQKANLSPEIEPYLQEIALSEQVCTLLSLPNACNLAVWLCMPAANKQAASQMLSYLTRNGHLI